MEQNNYNLLEHLKLVEQQIQRMADNSFKIKNWAITAIGGALLYWLKADVPKYNMSWLMIFIILATFMFWWLDAYYLTLEKCYRKLYMRVQEEEENSYDLSIKRYFKLNTINCVAISSKPLTHTYFALLVFEIVLFLIKYLKL